MINEFIRDFDVQEQTLLPYEEFAGGNTKVVC